MSHTHSPPLTFLDIVRLLRQHPARWLTPMLLTVAAAAIYAALKPTVWEASQALTVRDEAASVTPADRPGKFRLVEDMKTVQETILELAKSRTVLTAALAEVGPPTNRTSTATWPSDDEVAALQSAVKLSPPKGAEFGKTEVFYLQAQSSDRERAVELASALSDQLKKRFEDLRVARAQSLIDELTKTVNLASADLRQTTDRLAKIEREVGSDLGELRILADTAGGDSPLRRSVTDMQSELRGARLANQANEELLALLENARQNPTALISAPTRLLETQPALKRLKDGLVDAQLRSSQLMGLRDAEHPEVRAAKEAEAQIARSLKAEADSAIAGLKIELRLTGDRCTALETQLNTAKQRLAKLADIRADYSNLIAESHRRTETLKAAETQLSEARAIQAGAHTASLISRIDAPEAGASPLGPGRTTLLMAGAAGGFILGLGVLLLTSEKAAAIQPTAQTYSHTSAGLNGTARANSHQANGAHGDEHATLPLPGVTSTPPKLSLLQALSKIETDPHYG